MARVFFNSEAHDGQAGEPISTPHKKDTIQLNGSQIYHFGV